MRIRAAPGRLGRWLPALLIRTPLKGSASPHGAHLILACGDDRLSLVWFMVRLLVRCMIFALSLSLLAPLITCMASGTPMRESMACCRSMKGMCRGSESPAECCMRQASEPLPPKFTPASHIKAPAPVFTSLATLHSVSLHWLFASAPPQLARERSHPPPAFSTLYMLESSLRI